MVNVWLAIGESPDPLVRIVDQDRIKNEFQRSLLPNLERHCSGSTRRQYSSPHVWSMALRGLSQNRFRVSTLLMSRRLLSVIFIIYQYFLIIRYAQGKAEALGILCRIFCTPQRRHPFLRTYLERFYTAIKEVPLSHFAPPD